MKSAWRNLLKHKTYMLINLFGLTLGLSVSIFILLFVRDEFNYDKFLAGYEQISRIQFSVTTEDGKEEWATTEGFIIPMMTSHFPEIEASTRLLKYDEEIFLKTETEKFAQDGFLAVDSTFFQVFPFEFIYGDRQTALNTPSGIVITRSVAKKFFGDNDPIGKILTADFGDLTVNGVIEDVPKSSHFHFKIAYPIKSWWKTIDEGRGAFAVYSYLRLRSTTTPAEFQSKNLKDWYNRYGYTDDDGKLTAASGPPVTLSAVPIQEIHLQSHAEKEFEANGQLQVGLYFYWGWNFSHSNSHNQLRELVERDRDKKIKRSCYPENHWSFSAKTFREFYFRILYIHFGGFCAGHSYCNHSFAGVQFLYGKTTRPEIISPK